MATPPRPEVSCGRRGCRIRRRRPGVRERRPLKTPADANVTELLLAWSDGDEEALAALVPLVYQELHRLARSYLRREPADLTLQPTALVNEAYLRLVDAGGVRWENRAHFFGVSARLMRQILVDAARARGSLKRGGGVLHVAVDDRIPIDGQPVEDLLALDQALTSLSAIDERKGRVVELRYFGGLSVEETATVLGVSVDTVMRDWKFARVWLHRELVRRSGALSEPS